MMNLQRILSFMETGESEGAQTAQDLTVLTQQYPWFEGAHLLAALHEQGNGKGATDRAWQKAQLYTYDPLWFRWQMIKKDLDPALQEEKWIVDTPAMGEQPMKGNMINVPTAESADDRKEADDVLSFEPLHTIDYFASQGIKLQQDQLGNDHFSQQVKTFTQWLKSMKKIYHSETTAVPLKEEGQIEVMAAASNRNEEIVTETMAEVLISQGKKRQALAIYEKLSLLYPEKSSYFATRISQLNA